MSKVLGIEALAGIRDWVKSEDDAVKAELRTYVGSPLVASTVAGMTDQTKVYVYTGSETGYTAGNWYYYNGSAWTSGGVYNSTALETDPTLTIEGMAADAKATGDEITHVKQDNRELGLSLSTGVVPTILHGKYYTGNVGDTLATTDDQGSIYTTIDVPALIGQTITIKLKSTNNSSRKFGFCTHSNVIVSSYAESYTRENFLYVDGWYQGTIPITAEKFFFSYSWAGAGSVDPVFEIPTQTPLFTDTREKNVYDLIVDGNLQIPQEDYYQIGSEKRIWFSKLPTDFAPSLCVGDIISSNNSAYDVGYRSGNGIVNWSNQIVVTEGFIGYGIRKNDLSNISGMSQSAIKAIIKIERNAKSVRNYEKKARISLDDCVFWEDLIVNADTYTSPFQNSLLSDLRDIHNATGATFTLNCFCSTESHDISNVPEKFKAEFANNSSWLKFAFHAEDTTTHYNTDKVDEITASYQKFVSAIYTMTGTVDCIDTTTRLGFFTGTLNNVLAIRDEDCGINGLLTADDTRVSYYLDTATNNYMLKKGSLYDATNYIILIKSQTRLEQVTNIQTYCSQFLTVPYGNYMNYLEFFTHEYEWGQTMKQKVLALAEWLEGHGYTFTFWTKTL